MSPHAARSAQTLRRLLRVAMLNVLGLLLLTQTEFALACSCDEDWSPFEQQVRSAFQAADYVALIEVSSTSRVVITREENWADISLETGQSEDTVRLVDRSFLIANFNPLQIWKGDPAATTIETPAELQGCGVPFETGLQYLVYAFGPDEEGRIETSHCTRTAVKESSLRDLVVLDTLSQPTLAKFEHSKAEKLFLHALDLVHSYSGAGDELSRAMLVAESLADSNPESGFSQTILAESLSTWELKQNGEPTELRTTIVELADEALRLNPRLAQAHVAKARAYARASMLLQAEDEVAKALSIDPRLDSAIFQQAEVYRRAGNVEKAAEWYQDFILATPAPARKSNGYYWLGKMFQDVAYSLDGQRRDMYLQRARSAYQRMVDLDDQGAWRLVNFAIFLNGYIGDFAAAEVYARKSLGVMEFPMARYHLAAAQYQGLQARASEMSAVSLQAEIEQIARSTRVTLEQAIAFRSFHPVIVSRLADLSSRSLK